MGDATTWEMVTLGPATRRVCNVVLSEEQIQTAHDMAAAGRSNTAIAQALGMAMGRFYECRLYGVLSGLPSRRGQGGGRPWSREYIPTPPEIQSRSAEIRSRWTEEEERERRVGSSGIWNGGEPVIPYEGDIGVTQ